MGSHSGESGNRTEDAKRRSEGAGSHGQERGTIENEQGKGDLNKREEGYVRRNGESLTDELESYTDELEIQSLTFDVEGDVSFDEGGKSLRGRLRKPADPKGIVVLVTGSSGIRRSARERELTDDLFDKRIASVAVDLLTPTESSERRKRADVDLLSERLGIITDWITRQEWTESLAMGYYGTSTGAPAVLQFARYSPVQPRAISVYNGRLDLATAVPSVPLFCVVDERKDLLVELNEEFYESIKGGRANSEFLRAEEGRDVNPRIGQWFQSKLDRVGSSRKQI